MGRISSGVGLISGINSKDIIDQLISLESQPKTQLQSRIDATNQQKLAYTDLTARLSSLRITSQSLKKPSTFQASSTSSSDEDVLTATAANGAAVGTYQFQVARLVTTQQGVSAGFRDFDATAVGAGTLTLEQGGGDLTSQSALSQLNGGAGVRRGAFRVTDRSGKSAVIDISSAVSLDDVAKKINTSLDISVRAKIDGDKLVLTDLSGSSSNRFVVQDLGDGQAAADLGIVADTSSSTINGADINYLSQTTALDIVNDGRGIRTAGGTTADFRATLHDGSTIDVAVGDAKTVGDVLKAINTAGGGKLKASLATGADGIRLTDTTDSVDPLNPGSLAITALNSSNAAKDLGIQTTASGGTLNGGPIIAGLNTVLLSSLRGGTGLPLGTIHITDRSGGSADVNLSGAKTVQDVLDAISDASGVRVTASLKDSLNGVQIIDDSGGTGNLSISDVNSTTADALGLVGSFGTEKTAVLGKNLQRQWVTDNTLLTSYNGGKGVALGQFKITNSLGRETIVDLSTGGPTRLKDVIAKINSATGSGVTASINANGDGLLLTDTAGGGAKLKVDEVDGTTAADLNIKGVATGTTIDGTFERTVAIDVDDTLADVQTKINNASFGATASIVNDGSGTSPFRLSISSRNAGLAGRVVFDAGDTGVQTKNLVAAQDAAVFVGSPDSAQPLLVTASSNQLSGVVKGVTIDLHNVSQGPVTLSVTRSADALVDQFKKLTDDFNGLVDKLKELTSYDVDTQKGGLLLGEGTAQTIESNVYDVFGAVVSGSGEFRVLGDVGLKLGDGAKLEFDEDKFRAAYAKDPDAVQTLFGSAPPGLTEETRLSTLNSGAGVRTAAVGGNDFSITVKDGTVINVSLAGKESLGDVVTAINIAGAGKATAQITADGTSLKLVDATTTGTSTFSVQALNGSQAATDLGIAGASSSNGAITGSRLYFPDRSTLPKNVGIAYLFERRLTQLIDPVDGVITRQNQNLDSRTLQFQDRIDSLDKLIESKRTRLEKQFANLESVLSGLQSQQQALGSLGSATASR